MSSITTNTTFTLNGVSQFSIGTDVYTWDNGWLGYIDVYAGQAGAPLSATANLTASNWNMSTLRFAGNLIAKVSDSSSGADRWIESILLQNSGGSTVSLKVTGVGSIQGSQGVDTVTLGAGDVGTLSLRDGDDKVTTGSGSVEAIILGEGNNTVTTTTGWVGSITAYGGNDSVTTGTADIDSVVLGHGNNVLNATGWVGMVIAYDGDDKANFGIGGANAVSLSNGNNVVTTSSGWVGSIAAYDGNDTVSVGTGQSGSVNLGHGNNTLKATGWVDSFVGRSGNDTVTTGVEGAGSINVGEGTNSVTTGTGWVGAITGYDGKDTVNLGSGGAGAVSLYGGDDTVALSMLDVADDVAAISGGKGTDTVSFAKFTGSVTISLGSSAEADTGTGVFVITGFENLTGGGANDLLTGNSLANVIDGGKGNDVIRGYAGNDTLKGYAGTDTFIFNTALNATTNVDTITDYSAAADTIQIDNAVFAAFTKTGELAASAFKDIAVATKDADDRILYNSDTGILYYDADASGTGAAIKFAILTGSPTITAADFVVI